MLRRPLAEVTVKYYPKLIRHEQFLGEMNYVMPWVAVSEPVYSKTEDPAARRWASHGSACWPQSSERVQRRSGGPTPGKPTRIALPDQRILSEGLLVVPSETACFV
jgi:hypothetical protein